MINYNTAFWSSLVAAVAAIGAVLRNPARSVNQTLACAAVLIAAWMFALSLGGGVGTAGAELRLTAGFMAFIPWILSLIQDSILHPEKGFGARLWSGWGWLLSGGALLGLVFTDRFCSAETAYAAGAHSGAFHGFVALLGCGLAAFGMRAIWMMKGCSGARRLELLVLLLIGIGSVCVALLMMEASTWFREPNWERLMPLVFAALFAGLVWALISARVLNARHLLMLTGEKLVLIAVVSVFAWGVQQLAAQFIPELVAMVVAVAIALAFTSEVTPWLRSAFRRNARGERSRRSAVEVARKEVQPEILEQSFERILCHWSGARSATMLMNSLGRLSGGGLDLPVDHPGIKLLQSLRWATPERLQRERPDDARDALAELMREKGYGVMVAGPGPTLTTVAAVSVPLSQQPFTYPQVLELLEITSVMESALARAHYLMKAKRADQLATVGMLGASIAHEIRNPLVTIKTFVQLLPKHHQDTVFRDKFFRLIGDEVARIERLTEQLLDLSAPRVFVPQTLDINPLMQSCVDLIASKADNDKVQLIREFGASPGVVQTDPNAVKQVILNLGFNAIQALDRHPGEKWVRFRTAQIPEGVEIVVQDSGPGISQAIWEKLFQPFQSTKSSGFGLGLAICKDILSSLQASIVADPPTPGCGATFRIVLPCPPASS